MMLSVLVKEIRPGPEGPGLRAQLALRLYDIQVEYCDCPVKIGPNHPLTVASHDSLARCEIVWVEDCRSNDKWNVRSVDVTRLEVTTTLVADEDLVPWEVGILVDCEAVAQSTNLLTPD